MTGCIEGSQLAADHLAGRGYRIAVADVDRDGPGLSRRETRHRLIPLVKVPAAYKNKISLSDQLSCGLKPDAPVGAGDQCCFHVFGKIAIFFLLLNFH
jgi:hypothetical protein